MRSETGILLMHEAEQVHADGKHEQARDLESEARQPMVIEQRKFLRQFLKGCNDRLDSL